MTSQVTTIQGSLAGPTVAIFVGVHGDEPIGLQALERLLPKLKLTAGTAHFVVAHPEAVRRKVRYIEKNLNRCFQRDNTGKTIEDRIAQELMTLLDSCDALLDLHGYNSTTGQPFLITEKTGLPIARKLNFSIISTGWSAAEPGGTDSYMESQGKVGLCAECGSNLEPEPYVSLAEQTVQQFLEHFNLIPKLIPSYTEEQKIIHVDRAILKQTDEFRFQKTYNNFQPLLAGEVIAVDGSQEYRAGSNEYIIFPRPNAKIGDEAFLVGHLSP